jgi:LacI family transcriptional regulator
VIKKQTTINWVAKEAGVSKQTVSRVLNNRPDVAAETRTRVQEVIDRLGYQPSNLARRLKKRSQMIGVVTAQLGQYGPMRRLVGIEEAIKETGYMLHLSLIHQLGLDNGEQILKELLAWQVEGIIWAVPEINDNRAWLLDKLPQLPVPVLFVSEVSSNSLAAVAVDNRAGARLATEHLLEQGYQNIGLITGPLKWPIAQDRQRGWQDALSSAEKRQIAEGDWSAASGARGFRQLLDQYPEMDAVFACNDQMALGALQAAHELGRRVPRDLGVAGFDNTPESAYFWPPLTTVRHQLIEQGKIAVRTLIDMIKRQRQEESIVQPETRLLQPELLIRQSSIRNTAAGPQKLESQQEKGGDEP